MQRRNIRSLYGCFWFFFNASTLFFFNNWVAQSYAHTKKLCATWINKSMKNGERERWYCYPSTHILLTLTRAPLGYFYNAPHGGGAISSPPPPSDLRNYWTDSKNSSGIWKSWKNCWRKTNFIDLVVTSDVTGQVKVKMFDISGLVTSASKIAMLSTNKAN